MLPKLRTREFIQQRNWFPTDAFNVKICSKLSQIWTVLTSTLPLACLRGLRKNVPSMSGYLSYTFIGPLHNTHNTLDWWWAVRLDNTNDRISSFPWLPSSSIYKQKQKTREKLKNTNINLFNSAYFFPTSSPKMFLIKTNKQTTSKRITVEWRRVKMSVFERRAIFNGGFYYSYIQSTLRIVHKGVKDGDDDYNEYTRHLYRRRVI